VGVNLIEKYSSMAEMNKSYASQPNLNGAPDRTQPRLDRLRT
jgi:hypothetical protein